MKARTCSIARYAPAALQVGVFGVVCPQDAALAIHSRQGDEVVSTQAGPPGGAAKSATCTAVVQDSSRWDHLRLSAPMVRVLCYSMLPHPPLCSCRRVMQLPSLQPLSSASACAEWCVPSYLACSQRCRRWGAGRLGSRACRCSASTAQQSPWGSKGVGSGHGEADPRLASMRGGAICHAYQEHAVHHPLK